MPAKATKLEVKQTAVYGEASTCAYNVAQKSDNHAAPNNLGRYVTILQTYNYLGTPGGGYMAIYRVFWGNDFMILDEPIVNYHKS